MRSRTAHPGEAMRRSAAARRGPLGRRTARPPRQPATPAGPGPCVPETPPDLADRGAPPRLVPTGRSGACTGGGRSRDTPDMAQDRALEAGVAQQPSPEARRVTVGEARYPGGTHLRTPET